MKLEQQVTSLEISKRLRQLGVKQRSLFWWQATYSHPMGYTCPDCKEMGDKPHPCAWHVAYYGDDEDHFDISAFTCAELGELLPLAINGVYMSIFREKGLESWDVAYGTSDKQNIWEQAETLADAMAKMLIYLIENGLLKV